MMYYSRAKRRMALRIVLFVIAFLIFTVIIDQRFIALRPCMTPLSLLLPSFCNIGQEDTWNLFYHLGGNGPWIRYHGAAPVAKLPSNCEIDQVHMISRHAERYPTHSAGERHLALLKRLQASTTVLTGPLAFLRDWTYFVNVSSPRFEELTTQGPFAGTEQARRTGKILRERYDRLVDSNKTTKFWTCSSSRDIETARWFGDGFFGESWEIDHTAELQIISEDSDRGGNTLTPGDTCLKYRNDERYGHDQGYAMLDEWQNIFTQPIAERLSSSADGLALTPLEVYSMMEMCGFETIARGSSPWCGIFTKDEWQDFEYARDLLHFYRAGPGNDYAGAMGWLWLNATTTLLNADDARGVYLSFVHDGDIVPLIAALGLLNEPGSVQFLPLNHVKHSRKWKTSDVVPMGGRLELERITCNNTGIAHNLRRSYVRMYINDGVIDFESSIMGGGIPRSVGLTYWNDLVQQKGKIFGDFKTVCGLAAEVYDRITFLTPQYH